MLLMVNAIPGAGEIGELRKRIKVPSFVIKILLIVVLAIIAYLLWNHFHNSVVPSKQATPAQLENLNKNQVSGYLNSKDYTSYQSDRQALATDYLTNNNYDSAERVMNDVLKNVPVNKINSSSYSVLYQVEKAKDNMTLEKKYLGLMIAALKAEGKDTTADAAQTVLDGLK
jgi:hypothetical protein